MTATKSPANAIAELRAEYDARTAHITKLSSDTKALRDRLETLKQDIPAAIGEGRDASALIRERADAEAALRDMEPAIRVAHSRQEAADRELARSELPGLTAELGREAAEFRRLLRELHACARRIFAQRSHAQQRWNRAVIGDLSHPDHPRYAVKVGGAFGAGVLSMLADVGAIPADSDNQ